MPTLRDLDDRLVPELARRLDHLLHKLPTPPEPNGPAPLIVRLRRVDDRWTGTGPFALLRDVPQLGAVAVGLLLLVGLGVARVRSAPKRPVAASPLSPEETQNPEPDVNGGALGPQIGDNAKLYVAAAKARLVRAAASSPDGIAVAVLSLTGYQTPEQVRRLLGPTESFRVFFRAAPVGLADAPPETVAVADLVPDARGAFARMAAAFDVKRKQLEEVNPTIVNDPVQQHAQEQDIRTYRRAAEVLRGPCACVYAVVVRATLRRLVDLAVVPAVRVVDAGPPGVALDRFVFTGLLPEETVTVTGGNQAG